MGKRVKREFRIAFAVGAVATSLLLAGTARADIFDTTLASPNTHAATGSPNTGVGLGTNPSWFNGNGNPQGGWTVSTDPTTGIEVGLRAKYRKVDAVIHTPDDDYQVLTGGCTGICGSNPALALWNYEFSIDLRPGGAGSLTLADIATLTTLSVTVRDSSNAIVNSGSLNPITHWGDTTGFGSAVPGSENGFTLANRYTLTPATTGGWVAQNSQNLGFGDSPLAGFNPNANYSYEFVLTVRDNLGNVLGSTDMEVNATPEPSAWMLLGTMIFAISLYIRRKANA